MLGFLRCSVPDSIPKSITANSLFVNPTPPLPHHHHPHYIESRNRRRTDSATLASNNDDDPVTTATVFDNKNEGRRTPLLFDFKLSDLLNPDADNVLAVGLTGVLTWASLQGICDRLVRSFADSAEHCRHASQGQGTLIVGKTRVFNTIFCPVFEEEQALYFWTDLNDSLTHSSCRDVHVL